MRDPGCRCLFLSFLSNDSDIDALYQVRERIFFNVFGIRLIALYYQNAIELAEILEDNPMLRDHLQQSIAANRDVLTQLIAGKPAVATAKQVGDLVTFLEAVKGEGSFKVQHDINSVIKGIEYGYLLQGLGIQVEQ